MKWKPDRQHVLQMEHLRSREKIDKRAALFVGLGLGKTASTLSVLDELLVTGASRGALVLAPLRVANLTWPNEVDQWDHLEGMRVANLRTKEGWQALEKGSAQLYTLNYEAIPKLCEKYLSKKSEYAFDTVILDELTVCKNPKSKRILQLWQYLPRLERRWGLTGTPTPNSLLELFGQVRVLDDGARLGPSFERFKRTYFYPTDYMEYEWEPFEGAEEKIYSKVADLALTLRTEDYSNVPAPDVEDVSVHLPDEALSKYRTLEKEMVILLEDPSSAVVAQSAGVLVNKMLQVTGGAAYTSKDGIPTREFTHIHDAKINALRMLCSKHSPMIISCNYQHEQQRILEAIPEAVLWPKKGQQEFLEKWNRGEVPFIVADPRSIGHGLNLQAGGHHITFFSLPWSRELYDQLIGRLVRRGQEKVTKVFRLLCPGTVDDAVAETLRQKDIGQQALLRTLTNYRRMLDAK